MATIEYSSNNSGGSWWLSDADWYALEEAGWEVEWYKDETGGIFASSKKDGRWLGALASRASKSDTTMGEAIAEWEMVTGQDSSALGCSCCGTPHSFYSDDGEYYSPSYPAYGDRY